MQLIRHKLAQTIAQHRGEVEAVLAEKGAAQLDTVSLAQVFGGMRGVKALVCDTSVVDAQEGLIIRGHPILELKNRLPEEVFWLLATGSLPTVEELAELQFHLGRRAGVPAYVWRLLAQMDQSTPPMSLLSMAVLAMQRESVFSRRIWEKQEHRFWEFALEDALDLIARVPVIAAAIFRLRQGGMGIIGPDRSLDWAANYAHMLGLPRSDEVFTMMRRYLAVHSDHESGNATAYTFNVVSSALVDPYRALSAGLNALAGPLHGAASQGSMEMIHEIRERYGDNPAAADIEEFCWERLNSGRVILGYGHAVLRVTDPRFIALHEFGKQHFGSDPVLRIADLVYQVAPRVLKEHGKAKSPYPNVDAITGAVLYHYGITDYSYYTVLFGVGLMLGLLAQCIVLHGLGSTLMRPKSVTTQWLREVAAGGR